MLRILRNNLFFIIFGILAKLKSPKLTSYLIYISLRRLRGIKKTHSKRKLIILEKAIGIEDVRLCFSKAKIKYQPYVLQRRLLKLVFNQFLKGLHEHYYVTNDKQIERKKIDLRLFYTEVLRELKKKFKFEIIINFNWLYGAERELQNACKNNDIKFITHQKESNFLDGEKELFLKLFMKNLGTYKGDLMLAYSKRYADFLIKSGVVKKNKIKVIGMPRADKLFNKKINYKQKHILFFLMQSQRGIFKADKKAIKFWDRNIRLAIKSTLEVAKKYPEIKFIFKSKSISQDDINRQLKIINDTNLRNCQIIKGGESFNYIKNSKAIIAFNSTTILEGVGCKKKTVVPHFNINSEFKKKNVMKLSRPVLIAKNVKQFKYYLEEIITGKPYIINLDKQSKTLLEYHLGNSDGKSYKRFAKVINNI